MHSTELKQPVHIHPSTHSLYSSRLKIKKPSILQQNRGLILFIQLLEFQARHLSRKLYARIDIYCLHQHMLIHDKFLGILY